MARQTFLDLRDEALRRMGKLDASTTLQGRMEQVMTSGYYTLALTYHHYELHDEINPPLLSGEDTLDIDADVYVVMQVARSVPGTSQPTDYEILTHEHLYTIYPTIETGKPERYTRTQLSNGGQAVLHFDKRADQDYTLQLIVYERPEEPLYDGTVGDLSRLDPLWDEYIIQKTLALFWPAGFRFDFAGVANETIGEFLARQIQPPLVQPVRDVPERQLSSEAVGGQQ